MLVGIVGANGFIGSRVVEMFHLGGLAQVRPIVRSYSGLARCSRFDLDARVADALDRDALVKNLSGCDSVVHCVLGDPDFIVQSARKGYIAANAAGVKRFIYLSSASVHGQNPAAGTDEYSRLTVVQPLPYNAAKVRAERALMRLSESAITELVILRPGIVFGPRSRWTAAVARDILDGSAYLIDGGKGICNSIYVDNLVHAIHRATEQDDINKEAFILGDAESVTWADLYEPIAQSLGLPVHSIASESVPEFRTGARELVNQLRASKAVQTVLPLIPGRLKSGVKAGLHALAEQPAQTEQVGGSEGPTVTKEMMLLQQCSVKLPISKAERLLRYRPTVSFKEGCRRSVAWLQFAGYPVKQLSD